MVPNAICIVAKCPIPGKSKTRLSAAAAGATGLTDEGCALMAKAMLCDVLSIIHRAEELSSVVKFLYYAPADEEGKQRMGSILDELGICYVDGSQILEQADRRPGILDNAGGPSGRGLDVLRNGKWYLSPMPGARQSNLRSSDLGKTTLTSFSQRNNCSDEIFDLLSQSWLWLGWVLFPRGCGGTNVSK